MKTRYQKWSKTLQEFASEIEWPRKFALVDYAADIRENALASVFCRWNKIFRSADSTTNGGSFELKNCFTHVLKLEAAEQESRSDRHSFKGGMVKHCNRSLFSLPSSFPDLFDQK